MADENFEQFQVKTAIRLVSNQSLPEWIK